ncbi:MAG: tetratricopeptide repeat protein [Bacteroidota bacterium]
MYFKSIFIKLTFVILVSVLVVSCSRNQKPVVVSTDSTILSNSVKDISINIEKDPANAELIYQRAQIYYNQKVLDKSLSDIEQAINIDKKNPVYYYFKGRILYALNKTLKASDAYEEAVKLKPDYTEAQLKAAELYYIVKEHARSLRYLDAIISRESENAVAHFFKGMNHKEMKDTAKAIDDFQKAYEFDKNFYDAVIQLGLIYMARNNKLANEYFSSAIRINPKNDEAYFDRALYFQNIHQYKQAILDYRKVLSINPSNDIAYYNVGYINFETKHFDEAIRNWNICIQMNNNYTKAYYMRGLVYEMQNDKKNAKLNYEYTLQLEPNFDLAIEALHRLK